MREGDARVETRPWCISFEWWGWTQPLREGGGPIIPNQPPLPVPGAVGPTMEVVAAVLRRTEAVGREYAAALPVAALAGAELPKGHAGPVTALRRDRSTIAAVHVRVHLRVRRRVHLVHLGRMDLREAPGRIAVATRIGGTPLGTLVGMAAGTRGV